jgi:hypothetical protein
LCALSAVCMLRALAYLCTSSLRIQQAHPAFPSLVLYPYARNADGTRAQKIVTLLLKDLDDFARREIRDELASLDPLLRNMSVADERGAYEFDA